MEITQYLLEHGAQVNAQNESGQTAIHYACSKNHGDVVRLLLKHGAHVTIVNAQRQTALHRASAAGHLGVVQQLLSLRRNDTTITTTTATTTTSSEKPRVNAQDSCGNTALHLACEENHGEVAKCLLELGEADVSVVNADQKTALDLCSPQLRQYLERLLSVAAAE